MHSGTQYYQLCLFTATSTLPFTTSWASGVPPVFVSLPRISNCNKHDGGQTHTEGKGTELTFLVKGCSDVISDVWEQRRSWSCVRHRKWTGKVTRSFPTPERSQNLVFLQLYILTTNTGAMQTKCYIFLIYFFFFFTVRAVPISSAQVTSCKEKLQENRWILQNKFH